MPAFAEPDKAPPPPLPKRRYGIAVGSNAGGESNDKKLRFAARDAHMNAEVLRLAGYKTWVLPLDTNVDPTKDEVVGAIKEVVDEVQRGTGPAEVVFWYSGHGDNDGLYLAKMNLTNEDLIHTLLEPLAGKGTTVHVIIDACGALAFTKGGADVEVVRAREATGKVVPISAKKKAKGLNPEGFPDVGIIVATTLKQKAIEDPELQAGLFSYQLRSALLNGADASTAPSDPRARGTAVRDFKITYREAEAFVWAANADVDDDDVRMYVWARGPANNPHRVIVDWLTPPSNGSRPRAVEITVGARESAHFWVQDMDSPNDPHLFRINKGIEQDGSAIAHYLVPRRPNFKITRDDGTIWSIDVPPSGTMSWGWIQMQKKYVVAKLNPTARQSLDKGLFHKPYTMEVYATYDEMKRTNKRTNAVLIKEGSKDVDGEDEPLSETERERPQPQSRAGADLVRQAPLPPTHGSIGVTPWLLLSGAAAAGLSGYLAWREGNRAAATWNDQLQESAGYDHWKKETEKWDNLATSGLAVSSVLTIAAIGLGVYRWRRGTSSPTSATTMLAGDGIRVAF